MLGAMLTLIDKPIFIENGGVFALAMIVIALTIAGALTCCLVYLRRTFEELADMEVFERVERDLRMNEILRRVETDRGILC